MRLVLLPEIFQGRKDRIGCRPAKCTQGGCLDLLTEILELVQVLGHALSFRYPGENIEHLLCAFSAGNALSAGFALGELEEELGSINHTVCFVKHNKAA